MKLLNLSTLFASLIYEYSWNKTEQKSLVIKRSKTSAKSVIYHDLSALINQKSYLLTRQKQSNALIQCYKHYLSWFKYFNGSKKLFINYIKAKTL